MTDETTVDKLIPDGILPRWTNQLYVNNTPVKFMTLSFSLDVLRGLEWMIYSTLRPWPMETQQKIIVLFFRLFRHCNRFLVGEHTEDLLNLDKLRTMKEKEQEEEEDATDKKSSMTLEQQIEARMKACWVNEKVPKLKYIYNESDYDPENQDEIILQVMEQNAESEKNKTKRKIDMYEANWDLLFMLDTRFSFFALVHMQYMVTKDIKSVKVERRKDYMERLIHRVQGTGDDETAKQRHSFFLKRIVTYSQMRLYNYFTPYVEEDIDTIDEKFPLLAEYRSDVAMEKTFKTYLEMMNCVDDYERTLSVDALLAMFSKQHIPQDPIKILTRKSCFVTRNQYPFIAIEYFTNRWVLYLSEDKFYCFDSLLDVICFMIFKEKLIRFQIGKQYTVDLSPIHTFLTKELASIDGRGKKRKGKVDVTTL